MFLKNFSTAFTAALFTALTSTAAFAMEGAPTPWQLGLQASASPVMTRITEFHDLLLTIIVAITIFVTALLVYIIIRFRASNNPTPSKLTHNTPLEVVWTVVPILILVFIAIPSFKLLYFEDRAADADMTIKVTGHQWYWEYEYTDHDEITFDSYMVDDDELEPGQIRLLSVDNPVVLPVGATVRVLLTSPSDGVIHSWAVPALGVKTDTVPGRLNETWLKVEEEGWYYGQCSELCGTNHGFMPVAIHAVSQADFDQWVEEAKEEFASADQGDTPFEVAQTVNRQ